MIARLSSKHTSQPGFLYANTIKAPNKSPNNYFTFKKLIVYYYYSIQHRGKRGKEKKPYLLARAIEVPLRYQFFFLEKLFRHIPSNFFCNRPPTKAGRKGLINTLYRTFSKQ